MQGGVAQCCSCGVRRAGSEGDHADRAPDSDGGAGEIPTSSGIGAVPGCGCELGPASISPLAA
eukprot:3453669-Amphidinium_carterae.2